MEIILDLKMGVQEFLLIFILLAIVSGVALILFAIKRRKDIEGNGLIFLQQQIDGLSRLLSEQMGQMTSYINERLKENIQTLQGFNQNFSERLDRTSQIFGQMQHKLGLVEEGSKRIFEIGKEISSLQQLLKAPKFRGGLGEFILGDLISQILPKKFFETQYTFKNNARVDAVIRVGQRLLPVDAKFPLENFRKYLEAKGEEEGKKHRKMFFVDVKKHIDEISKKYILPDEGTYDFAFMYIPAENVYYEIIRQEDGDEKGILEYALMRRVIPVSPNTFYAYLQVILLGLKGMEIEENARIIHDQMSKLKNDFEAFIEELLKMEKHLNDLKSSYERVERRADRVKNDLDLIVSLKKE